MQFGSIYLINKTESPALSRFAPTKRLHPVVRRWRFGCPVRNNKWKKKKLEDRDPGHLNIMFSCEWPKHYVAMKKLISQTVLDPTTINMTECPHVVMQIPNDKLLVRRLHRVILRFPKQPVSWSIHKQQPSKTKCGQKTATSCGNNFSAALLGTEKPPCVLVSLAVKFLQKYSPGCLLLV
jgi:hypothetical protein